MLRTSTPEGFFIVFKAVRRVDIYQEPRKHALRTAICSTVSIFLSCLIEHIGFPCRWLGMLALGDRALGRADLCLWISPPGRSIKQDAVL
jgi:hypothetical protein